MAGISENLGSGAFKTYSSGNQQDRPPALPISSPMQVAPIHFETGSSSVIGRSSGDHTVSCGFGDQPSLITWRNNLPYLRDSFENQSSPSSFEVGISSDLSLGGISQNLLRSTSFGIGSSSGPQINRSPENQVGFNGSGIMSFPGQFTDGTPRTYFQLNGSGIKSSDGPYIGGSSIGLDASSFGSSIGLHVNSPSIGMSVFGTRPYGFFASVGLESGSSPANWQDDNPNDEWEIYYGSDAIRMRPSRVVQENNVPIISDTSKNPLGSRGIQLEPSTIRRQSIQPRRGRPRQNRPSGVKTGSSSLRMQISHSNKGHETSGNSVGASQIISGSTSGQPTRMTENFSVEDRLHYKMAKAKDWTEEEIAIVEKKLKQPSDLTKQAWFASVSRLLHDKTSRDVSMFVNCFMKERNAKRIKVDLDRTTNNDRKEHVPNSSPSSSHLAGSFGPGAQGTTVNNQDFPPQPALQETANAAPPHRTDEELGNSVSSPTCDFDINLLLNLTYSPERTENLSHVLPPPEPNLGLSEEP